MSRIGWAALMLAVVAAGLGSLYLGRRSEPERFVTEVVTTGDLARAITATGSVNPVATVQVGSYVSGPIVSIACDFNTRVQAGQLCAKIDARPYQAVVDQARANLESAEAQLAKDRASFVYAGQNLERDRGLRKTGVVSQNDFDLDTSAYGQAEAQVRLDEATVAQRRAALAAAELSLSYTNIVSPVSGTVVGRNVDMGQTVAASFQTPTLFLIGKDLTKMQVDTNVSEADIGLAQVGQRALFTVEAHPGRRFEGKVVQVRRAPITVQNVVTYNVVIGVENPENLLFPGMTANVRILVEERAGVKKVPSRALRFEPEGVGNDIVAAGGGAAGRDAGVEGPRVYVLREGEPVAVPVEVGIDDGLQVEILSAAPAVGEAVIVDVGDDAGGAPSARSPLRF